MILGKLDATWPLGAVFLLRLEEWHPRLVTETDGKLEINAQAEASKYKFTTKDVGKYDVLVCSPSRWLHKDVWFYPFDSFCLHRQVLSNHIKASS